MHLTLLLTGEVQNMWLIERKVYGEKVASWVKAAMATENVDILFFSVWKSTTLFQGYLSDDNISKTTSSF